MAEGAKLAINTSARIGGLKHKIREKWEISAGTYEMDVNLCPQCAGKAAVTLQSAHSSSADTKHLTGSPKQQPELEGNCFC